MSTIEILQKTVANDHALLKSQLQRLEEYRTMNPKDIKASDRNQIVNWSRSSTTEYNAQLLAMEQLPKPTKEEKQVMQELNKLIMLGDELLQRTRELREELNAKLLAAGGAKLKGKKKSKAPDAKSDEPVEEIKTEKPKSKVETIKAEVQQAEVSKPKPSRAEEPKSETRKFEEPPKVEKVVAEQSQAQELARKKPSAGLPTAPIALPVPNVLTRQPKQPPVEQSPVAHTAPAPVEQVPVKQVPSDHSSEVSEDSVSEDEVSSESESADGAVDSDDPLGAYALLGLPHTASMAELRSAIRKKKMALHPDRNAGDPDAGTKFTEFDLLSRECFDNEAKRAAYDNIKTKAELATLSARVSVMMT